ncbi:MAG TPA: VTT domain-containing protein [Vicinamibacterales bacterium]
MPFGVDALVIYLTARDHGLFWLYPLLATAGSVGGAAVMFWIGRKAGDVGLPRLISKDRLERLRARVQKGGAVAVALPALLPPPFPLTPFVLTCGALKVNPWWFFPTFGLMRLLRFSVGAALALLYGPGILRVLESGM